MATELPTVMTKLDELLNRADALIAKRDANKQYTVEKATEWGIGTGPNGTGKRAKVSGFYVVSPEGRRVRAFEINKSKPEDVQRKAAESWAKELTERMS